MLTLRPVCVAVAAAFLMASSVVTAQDEAPAKAAKHSAGDFHVLKTYDAGGDGALRFADNFRGEKVPHPAGPHGVIHHNSVRPVRIEGTPVRVAVARAAASTSTFQT